MLTVRNHMALTLAGAYFKHPGARQEAIRHTLGYSEPRFAQVVGALLDDPVALAERPSLVLRLRRLRDDRRAARAS